MGGKFKLIAGLGCKDAKKVSDLVSLYMEAGADIFDLSPSVLLEVEKSCIDKGFNLADFDFCTSIAIAGDIHGKKAKINPCLCKKCGKCSKKCPEAAIYKGDFYCVEEKKCIGCMACKKVCKSGAINMYDDTDEEFYNLLRKDAKIDTIEIHISIKNKKVILKEFQNIINAANESPCTGNSKISVCFSRKYFSNLKTEKILDKLKKITGDREFLVQTDGISMNAGNNELAGTIEAVAFGLFVQQLGYKVTLSGGCNEYTAELAKRAGLLCSIGYGTYARQIVAGKTQKDALISAKNFVQRTKEFLK